MQQAQSIMEAAEQALLRDAREVFGTRVYPDRTEPFDPGPGKKILPAICIYVPQMTLSTEGKPLVRGMFSFTQERLVLELWARVDPADFKTTEALERAQAKALRLGVQIALNALLRSNTLLSLWGQLPKIDVHYGADVNSQARADAARIEIIGANQGIFAACTVDDAIALKSIFLDNEINEAVEIHARYLELDKEE